MKWDKQHFVKAIQNHTGIINSLCRIYYPINEDFKDARQDVILQLWKSFQQFKNESKISTWIYKVVLNTLLNKKRKEAREIPTESLDSQSSEAFISQIGSDDQLRRMIALIATLKPIDKGIVILFLEGYHNKEIANILSITTSNVSTRLNRIKKNLKNKHNNNSHVIGKL